MAQRTYLVSAVLRFALLGTIIGTHLAMSVVGANALTSEARCLVRFLLLPKIAGTALLWIAMWYFWFGFDRSHYLKKAFWLALLFFLAPIGPLLYYFASYRRGVSSLDPGSVPQMNR